MGLIEKIDDLGKPAWIALLVLSFILFWPVGLALQELPAGPGGRSPARWKLVATGGIEGRIVPAGTGISPGLP